VNLVVTPRARRDLEMLIDWVAERAPVAARRASTIVGEKLSSPLVVMDL
jgi:plasmid stabilization system protein ParE